MMYHLSYLDIKHIWYLEGRGVPLAYPDFQVPIAGKGLIMSQILKLLVNLTAD